MHNVEYCRMLFADENVNCEDRIWKILIVDDDKDVHLVTKLALKSFKFENIKLEFVSAYSAKESIEILKQEKNVALILLDVVMETDDAGFKVADFLRDTQKNISTRIILRTGQPGLAPEQEVIEKYDINDYKNKTELTIPKLFTTVRSSLRAYRDIVMLEICNKQLKKKIDLEVKKSREKDEIMLSQSKLAAKAEMVQMLAHQWRQPLAVVSLMITGLQLRIQIGEKDFDKIEQKLVEATDEIQKLSKMIDLFSFNNDKIKYSEEIMLDQLINELFYLVSSDIELLSINIIKNIDVKNHITIKKAQFAEIFINIMKNSFEIFKLKEIKEPKLVVNAFEKNGEIIISICDNGGGIEEDILENIFEAYFTTKNERNKAGLGLFIAKSITEKELNGVLTAYNKDNGACFKITLPIKN